MSTELLPCPFCGRAPTWVEQSGSYGYTPPSLSLGCGCAMNPHASRDTEKWEQGRGHFTVDPHPELIAAWNTRATAPPASIRERTPEERVADKANMRAVHLSGLPAAQRQEQEGGSHG